jgi:nucleotide-binding universal stress UspA family protein
MSTDNRTIVVGFVPTAEGEAAVTEAISQARMSSARIVIVRSYRDESDQGQDQALDLRLVWLAAHDRLTESGVPFDVREMTGGSDPADDLVSVAEEVLADLIVIGLRRRSPVGKLIMGSNAQKILLHAECPVLAVKTPAA